MTGPPVTGPGRSRRIVSLVPSLTETLLSWGVEPAGVTRFCEVDGFPLVGGTKNPDLDAISRLQPDVVLMDREENRRTDAEALEAAGLTVVAVHVRSVADVGPAMARVAAAVGRDGRPDQSSGIGPREPVPSHQGTEVPVWVPIWRRPWMTIGPLTYGSSILEQAGFRNVYRGSDDAYPVVDDLDEVGTRAPAFVLAPSEPYPFQEKHRAELATVAPVVFVDGKDLFWWGARTPEARRRLTELAAELAGR